jgi:hypothetical protein
VEKFMENPEEIRLWLASLVPLIVSLVTGAFLIHQQKLKDKAAEPTTETLADKTEEEARRTGAETAKQITTAARDLISEYQGIMKTIKEQYGGQLELIQKEIDLVKQDNIELKRCNKELEDKYNELLSQNTILIRQNKDLVTKIEDLELKINGKEDVPCPTE